MSSLLRNQTEQFKTDAVAPHLLMCNRLLKLILHKLGIPNSWLLWRCVSGIKSQVCVCVYVHILSNSLGWKRLKMHFWQTKARKLCLKVTRWGMFTLFFWSQTTASWGITASEWEPLVFDLFISQKNLITQCQILLSRFFLNYVMRWKGATSWIKVPNRKKRIQCQWKCSLKRVTQDFNTQ